MNTLEEFKPFYHQLLPELEELEKIRLSTFKKVTTMKYLYIAATPVWVLFTCILGYVVYTDLLRDPENALWETNIGIAIYYGLFLLGWWGCYFILKDWMCNRLYFSQIYTFAMPYLARFIDPDTRFEPLSCMPPELYFHSGLYPKKPHGYVGQNLIYGRKGSTNIAFSELETWEIKEDRKGNKQKAVIFNGLFMAVDFHKHFNSKTRIVSMENFSEHFTHNLSELVEMEDPSFNEVFSVYSNDPLEARYLLSTSMMQNMVRFKEKMKQPVCFSFVDDHFYVAINDGKLLDFPPIHKSLLAEETAFDIFDNVILFTDIVNDLNLNTRLWSKQPA